MEAQKEVVPCCCCVSHCPQPPLSSNSMTSPSSSSSPLVGFGTCDWWSRPGSVVIARVPIHQWTGALYSASHLRRGQFLHFQTRLERGIIFGGEIAFLLHLCHILQTPARLFAVSSGLARSSVPVGEGGVRAWLEYFGRKLAVFVQSFDRFGSFVAPEAWEETSPKPLEKRKPRWKNQAKLQPWLQRPTDR